MRLIDADYLKEIIEYQQTINPKLSVYDVIKLVDNAPIVKVESCRDCPFVEDKDKRITENSCFENCPLIRPTGEYQKRALELINTLNDENKITIRQVGTLRRAILAEPDRPTGEWIYTNKEDKQKGYGGYCSVCKCDMPIGINDWKQEYYESKFCPNCGAKIKGAEK